MPMSKEFFKNPSLAKASLAMLAALGGYAGATILGRKLVHRLSYSFVSRLMQDEYIENLWEFVSAARRTGLQTIVETSLRSQTGKIIQRPLGTPRKFPGLEGLIFDFAQLATLPTPASTPVDTRVTIGPLARKPLRLQTPILISGMAYGMALSEKAKVALALGASMAGTASNTGEGAFLAAERRAADRLIIQYNRGAWNKEPEILKKADAIEIQLGQGATGGVGRAKASSDIDAQLRRRLGLTKGQDAVIYSRMPGLDSPKDLGRLVSYLREVCRGVPIGVKIAAGDKVEKDLDLLLAAKVDYINIDCAEGATIGAPPILEDDFGLPLLYALSRSARHLERKGARGRISLIVSGGLFSPGQFLKALALGADAVYIGSIALFALSHTQTLKALPWEPPTQLVYYRGKYSHKLNVKKAAYNLANFLHSCTLEMTEGVRALGKTSIPQVNIDDLCALDPLTAMITGIRPAYQAPAGWPAKKDKATSGGGGSGPPPPRSPRSRPS